MDTILAIDLGKYKSVFCKLDRSSLKTQYRGNETVSGTLKRQLMAKSQIGSPEALTDPNITNSFVPAWPDVNELAVETDQNAATDLAPVCPDVSEIVTILVADYNDVSTVGFHVFRLARSILESQRWP